MAKITLIIASAFDRDQTEHMLVLTKEIMVKQYQWLLDKSS